MEVTLSFKNHSSWPSKDFWWKVPVSFLLGSLHRPPPQGPSGVLRPILVDPSVVFRDRERKSLHVVQLARLRSIKILVSLFSVPGHFFYFQSSLLIVFQHQCLLHLHNSWVRPASLLELFHCQPVVLETIHWRQRQKKTETEEGKYKNWQIQGLDSPPPWTPQSWALSLDNHIFHSISCFWKKLVLVPTLFS